MRREERGREEGRFIDKNEQICEKNVKYKETNRGGERGMSKLKNS